MLLLKGVIYFHSVQSWQKLAHWYLKHQQNGANRADSYFRVKVQICSVLDVCSAYGTLLVSSFLNWFCHCCTTWKYMRSSNHKPFSFKCADVLLYINKINFLHRDSLQCRNLSITLCVCGSIIPSEHCIRPHAVPTVLTLQIPAP